MKGCEIRSVRVLGATLFAALLAVVPPCRAAEDAAAALPARIGFHDAVHDEAGRLLPWTSWDDVLTREVEWYLRCPDGEKGYPVYFHATFMNGSYQAYRTDFIPATQVGMGILSYVKYWRYTGKADRRVMRQAARMGDFLAEHCLTPDEGAYPRFPRSTGVFSHLPIDSSAQGDAKFGPNVIEPDKGGIAGYAFLTLYHEQCGPKFLDLAAHAADVLVQNMREGDAARAPWPFRVDAVTGEYWGERNGNMVYILRLFDGLIARGMTQYQPARDRLWNWIKTYQIDAPDSREQSLWIQFFEDMTEDDNRNSWAPLEMARYLIEQKDALDPDWKSLAERCIQFATTHFAIEKPGGAVLMGEQDSDKRPWGGACSKLGAVAALFYAAGGGEQYKELAYRNLNWATYFVDEDGGPAALWLEDEFKKGSWQEDCHTDVVHNFVDALTAVPEWADGPRGRQARPERIGFHTARYNDAGKLIPYLPLGEVVKREVDWYRTCGVLVNGYPSWVCSSFVDDAFRPFKTDIVAGCQCGMGILSHLKYWEYTGKTDAYLLDMARAQGDYLVKECNTTGEGVYPLFTRSTGNNTDFPLKKSSQGDSNYGENVIEPDKGGLAGYALLKLYDATGGQPYLEQAIHNADCLVKNMRPGTSEQAPWPFRVDSVTGQHWGERNGNMAFILRLFDELLAKGHDKYQGPRDTLWKWVRDVQIPAPDNRGESHWMQFFEDQVPYDNRTSWAPLEMARYLIEGKEALAPDWMALAEKCIQFALRNFSKWEAGGVTSMCEQDIDLRPWSGACSKLGGVAAMFYAAGGGEEYGEIAFRNLTWMAYHTDDDGCPGEITGFYGRLRRAGWQTDSHCDKLINFADAFAVLPEWAEAKDFPAQAAVEDGQARLADLSQGVIVVPEDSGILAKAADMLSEEIERRTGVRLPQAPEQPVDARPAIVLGAAAQPGGAAPPAGLVVPDKADGYALWVDSARPEAPVVHLRGHDPRGTLFAAGRFLRIAELDAGKVAVAASLKESSAPAYPIRGHQLGYRDTPNAFDAWETPEFEQYLRDLVIFGTNAVEFTTSLYPDEPKGPLMSKTTWEMTAEWSKVLEEYGIDCWIWQEIPSEVDVGKPDEAGHLLERWRALLESLTGLDAVFVPGGDGGLTPAPVLMPFLERLAPLIQEIHPGATLWVSNQTFEDLENDFFFEYLQKQQPEWLDGVVYGPWTKMSLHEMRERTPKRYPIRHYPDITHNVRCQYPVQDWDRVFAHAVNREAPNPRPRDMRHIARFSQADTGNFVTYSEGVNDDLNKIVWSAVGWAPDMPIKDILLEYGRVFFGGQEAEPIAKGLRMLEDNWRGPVAENLGLEAALRHWRALELRNPEMVQSNWRFQMYLLRAYCDAYLRRRAIVEARCESRACSVLLRASEFGSETAISKARAELAAAERDSDSWTYRYRIEELCQLLFDTIGMQLSIHPPYLAKNPERGAVLDTIDCPLNNRVWMEAQFREILALKDTAAQTWRLTSIANWEHPVRNRERPLAGIFYDDLGNPFNQPHVLRETAWEADPGYVNSVQCEYSFATDNISLKPSACRLSWLDQGQTLYGQPLRMRYEGLEPGTSYVLRVTYAGRFRSTMRLVADGVQEIHGWLPQPKVLEPIDFDVPPEAVADGVLELEWQLSKEKERWLWHRPPNRGCQVAEVWLLKK